jgi:hypothetical protein
MTTSENAVNGTAVAVDSERALMGNTLALRVGRMSGTNTNYADIEFTAAAIFRRALTAREITVINNAAPWGT